MEKFAIGLAIGGLAGALLTANNYKMRTLVRKGQEEVQAKLDKLMDEKIEALEESTEAFKEKATEKVEDAVDTIKEKTSKPERKSTSKKAKA